MCGSYIPYEQEKRTEPLCEQCIRDLPRTEQFILRQNSTEMAVGTEAAAFLFFDKNHPIQLAVHKMKYANEPMIGYQLGYQAGMEMRETDFGATIDRIIPIPLHPKRFRERGYNQSDYIARGLGDALGKPVDTTHLVRVKNTPKQALQTGEGRLTNMASAFEVNHPEQLYHQRLMIVDDLITTGETMRSALSALRAARGATMTVFALCKAR